MANAPPIPRELYSIVILGRMNPAIHHPTWYQYLQLLDQEECDSALAGPSLISSPPVSQFVAPAFTIVCTLDRWQIQTSRFDFMDRMLATASTVFEVLTHTPIGAFGFNFHAHKDVRVSNAGHILGAALTKLPLGLESPEDVVGEISVVATEKGHKTIVSVAPSPLGTNTVWIRFNSHYDIIAAEGVHFDLKPLLQEHFWVDHARAQQCVQSVVEGLPKMGDSHGDGD